MENTTKTLTDSEPQISQVVQKTVISEENSRRITSLRFFLMALVVLTHNNETLLAYIKEIPAASLADSSLLILKKAPLLFLSTGISCSVIQIFFAITSYFQNVKDYPYKVLLKKKFASLAIPYFAWILLTMLVQILPKLFMNVFFPSHVSDPTFVPFISNWTADDWLHGLLGYELNPQRSPFVYAPYIVSFWFIRDLIILTLVSPLLKFIVRKAPIFVFSVISINYLFFNWNYGLVFNNSFYFYMVGIYLAEYRDKINSFALADKIKWYEVLPFFAVAWYFEMRAGTNTTHVLTTFSSLIMFLKASKFLISNEKLYGFLSWISKYLFFAYAMHEPLLLKYVNKVFHAVVHSDSLFFQYLQYFTVSSVTFAIAILTGIIIHKKCPKLFEILNGGR